MFFGKKMTIISIEPYMQKKEDGLKAREVFTRLESYFSKEELNGIDLLFHTVCDEHSFEVLKFCQILYSAEEQKLKKIITRIKSLDEKRFSFYLLTHHAFSNPLFFRCFEKELSQFSKKELQQILAVIRDKFPGDCLILDLLSLSIGFEGSAPKAHH